MSIKLLPRGCVDVQIEFETASVSDKRLLQDALEKVVKCPEGGEILNFHCDANKAHFTVKGQCETSASKLEVAAQDAGFRSARCAPSTVRRYDPTKDKK